MKVEDIKATIEEIKFIVGDSEAAHGMEDDLYQDVLRAIAEGAENPAELATAALEAAKIQYTRWYA